MSHSIGFTVNFLDFKRHLQRGAGVEQLTKWVQVLGEARYGE